MRLIAQLTMPGNNSWNGRWSGEGNVYTKAIKASPKQVDALIGSYGYNFGDGWFANVEIRKPKPRERVTNRFFGYEWMIRSIQVHGEIKI